MKLVLISFGALFILGLGWYGLSPLLETKKLNDALPVATDLPQNQESLRAETQLSSDQNTLPQISEPVPIVDTLAHPASGQVRIIKNGNQTTIRYENYKTINGPDVRVYLAKDKKATDFVDLGPIKGTEGNINYEVPEGVNIDNYPYVLTWCEDFSVLFNSANLSTIR